MTPIAEVIPIPMLLSANTPIANGAEGIKGKSAPVSTVANTPKSAIFIAASRLPCAIQWSHNHPADKTAAGPHMISSTPLIEA